MPMTESNVYVSERNKELCLSMVAAWNRWELDGIIEHWADDVVHYSEDQPVDTDEMVQRMEAGLRAFPDLHLDVRSIIAEGDRVSLRITVTATNKDEFLGRPATGRKVRWFMVEELRFVDGKVVEHWDVFNYMPMLKELGRVPADLM
ncbi:C-1 hydroxylase [Nocardiopsis arvandica]|uniref:C-1 hydroxylase n=1 Tax=Nocardiopsis sinuspersici TaxID=501010 RepID=A0A7Z0BNK2_9ACTN|nr:ester cyclase [Nocardiopsis sinuspersici]NYH55667.1 C-1 hydroxylase [Nocardiopsis sinuspersici]